MVKTIVAFPMQVKSLQLIKNQLKIQTVFIWILKLLLGRIIRCLLDMIYQGEQYGHSTDHNGLILVSRPLWVFF